MIDIIGTTVVCKKPTLSLADMAVDESCIAHFPSQRLGGGERGHDGAADRFHHHGRVAIPNGPNASNALGSFGGDSDHPGGNPMTHSHISGDR